MKFNKDAPRYRAGKGELIGGTGGITQMCSAVDFLEIYKVDKTFRVYPPEALDPEETDPNMPWMSKPVADIGSANKIVARVFIQSHEAIKNTPLKKNINKDDILRCMHRCKELLLICDSKQKFVNNEVERICEIELKKDGHHYVEFPQVNQLEENCAVFLSNAKLSIQTLAELINIFYKTSFDGPHFHKIASWAKEELKHNKDFVQYLKMNEPNLKYIVSLRNAQEHPKQQSKLIIENFQLKPTEKIAPPLWNISGTNSTKPSLIHLEMKTITDFLIAISEGIFLNCVMDNIESSFPFIVRLVDDTSLNPNCPIKYYIEPNLDGINRENK
ncbi:MAG: hypothetical protein WCE45_04355 [Sedimentisphaerales bacterium]